VRLELVPLGPVPPAVLERLMRGLPGHLPVQPVIVSGRSALAPPSRSIDALDQLLENSARGRARRLGLTAAPLSGEDGDPVLGEATVGGPVAVISLAPLASDDEALFARRVLVSALHELGHLAGAGHCADPGCVMYASRRVADTDRKGPAPCPRCAGAIRAFFADGA
jgi:archaemetzincin